MQDIKKVIIHSVTHFTIYNFRLPLIKELQSKGIQVIALGKQDEYTKLLENEDIKCIDSKISIDGMNPIKEIKWILYLRQIFKKEKPTLVHHFTPKCAIFGSIASKTSKIKTISSISGLGYAFMLSTFHPIRIISIILYYISNFFTDRYIFQNIDDMRYFLTNKITNIKKSKLIVSSGVDLDKYNYKNCDKKDDKIRFTFIGRLLYDKGIKEFLEASLIIHDKYKEVEFMIVGDNEYENPKIMDKNELEYYKKANKNINYVGKQMDIRDFLCKTSVFVLPSYREGVPRSTLEAMAYKKPIITCDSIGCRTTTKHGYNGFLTEIKNSKQISKYMEYFINNPDKIIEMGENSYQRVLSLFDAKKVNKKTLSLYEDVSKI